MILSRARSFSVLSLVRAACSEVSEFSKPSLAAPKSATRPRSSANCGPSASLICSQWWRRCTGHTEQLLHSGTCMIIDRHPVNYLHNWSNDVLNHALQKWRQKRMVLQANFVEEYSFAAVSSIFYRAKNVFQQKKWIWKKQIYNNIIRNDIILGNSKTNRNSMLVPVRSLTVAAFWNVKAEIHIIKTDIIINSKQPITLICRNTFDPEKTFLNFYQNMHQQCDAAFEQLYIC